MYIPRLHAHSFTVPQNFIFTILTTIPQVVTMCSNLTKVSFFKIANDIILLYLYLFSLLEKEEAVCYDKRRIVAKNIK